MRSFSILVLMVGLFGGQYSRAERLHADMKPIIEAAKAMAAERKQTPSSEHLTAALLQALLDRGTEHTDAIFKEFHLDDTSLKAAKLALEAPMKALPEKNKDSAAMSEDLKQLMEDADLVSSRTFKKIHKRAAKKTDLLETTPTHYLVAMLGENAPESIKAPLSEMRADPASLNKYVKVAKRTAGSELEKYSINRTKVLRTSEEPAPIGFDGQVTAVLQKMIKPSGTHNVPMLVSDGDIEDVITGVAHRIIEGDVNPMLQDKEVLSLDIGALTSGTKMRGSLEKRLTGVFKDLDARPDTIIFVPDIDRLTEGEDKAEVLNMLRKQAQKKGARVVFSSSVEGARKVEADPILKGIVAPIPVNAMTEDISFIHLRTLADQWEASGEYGNVRISDKAIKVAIEKARLELPGQLPWNAKEILGDALAAYSDEMAAKKPTVLNEGLGQEIGAARAALSNAKALPAGRLRDVQTKKAQETLDKLTARAKQYEDAWSIRNQLKKLDPKVPADQIKIGELLPELSKVQKELGLFLPELDEAHVIDAISRATGKPTDKIGLSLEERLLALEGAMMKRVMGQDEAVKLIAARAQSGVAGYTSPRRPIGSFLFYGPTGVGKTELARVLQDVLYNDPSALIEIAGGEYMEASNMSKLFGADPGYVGFEDGVGKLEEVRQRPYSVVLFDEIEKFHPSIFRRLLGVLEDGKAIDSHGRVIRFNRTIIIFTSNLGQEIARRLDLTAEQKNALMDEEFRLANIPPEFVGRVDVKVPFKALTETVAKGIADILINKSVKEIFDPKGEDIVVHDRARAKILEFGFNDKYGARQLREAITTYVDQAAGHAAIMHRLEILQSGRFEIDYDDKGEEFVIRILAEKAMAIDRSDMTTSRKCEDVLAKITKPGKPLFVSDPDDVPAAMTRPQAQARPEPAAPPLDPNDWKPIIAK